MLSIALLLWWKPARLCSSLVGDVMGVPVCLGWGFQVFPQSENTMKIQFCESSFSAVKISLAFIFMFTAALYRGLKIRTRERSKVKSGRVREQAVEGLSYGMGAAVA